MALLSAGCGSSDSETPAPSNSAQGGSGGSGGASGAGDESGQAGQGGDAGQGGASGMAGSSGTAGFSGSSSTTGVKFHEDLEPLLQKQCQSCHRPGGAGPFSLMTYEEAKPYGELLADAVEKRQMPPWGESPTDDCKPRFGFKDSMRLSDGEIQTFKQWVADGKLEGDPANAPKPVEFTENHLDKPTHNMSATKPYLVKANPSKDEFQCFVLDPGFTQDTYVNGFEVLADAKSVTHHAVIFADPDRESLTKMNSDGYYSCFGSAGLQNQSLISAWAPGAQPQDFGPDTGMLFKAGTLIVMQMHYHPEATKDVADQTKFVMRTVDKKPSLQATFALIGNAGGTNGPVKLLPGPNDDNGLEFLIPASVSDHTETMEFTFPDTLPISLKVANVGSHMHWVGSNAKVEVKRKNPTPKQPADECLVATPHYDFNWQRGYTIDAPFEDLPEVAAGDTLRIQCTYDNTLNNPGVKAALAEKNMSSPVPVKLGDETLDEMCLGTFLFIYPNVN